LKITNKDLSRLNVNLDISGDLAAVFIHLTVSTVTTRGTIITTL